LLGIYQKNDEKFLDIKCRKAGLAPSAVVLVATVRALKYHGGVEVKDVGTENLSALRAGLVNLERHIHNIQHNFGLPCVVAINHRTEDTLAEIELLKSTAGALGVEVVLAEHWAKGGSGAAELAHAVVKLCDQPNHFKFLYQDATSLLEKVDTIAIKTYGAVGMTCDAKVRNQFAQLEADGYGHLPVCIAKTQYSFSSDAKLRGAPSGHTLAIREVRLAAGAGFVVVVCGDIMTMPGLPVVPAANNIDINEAGDITGLS
jgi:formate--tetrahydrofolate ligase